MPAKLDLLRPLPTLLTLTACAQRILTQLSQMELATIALLLFVKPARQVICVLLASQVLLSLATLAYSVVQPALTA